MSEKRIAKRGDPVGKQVRVKRYDDPENYRCIDEEEIPNIDEDESIIVLENDRGVEGYCIMDQARAEEYIVPGIETVEALEKLCRQDSITAWSDQPENFEPDDPGYDDEYNPENVWSISTPSLEEINAFSESQNVDERLDKAETEAEKEEVLKEVWEKAAEFEPERNERFG